MILCICVIPFYEVQCYVYKYIFVIFITVDKGMEAIRDE